MAIMTREFPRGVRKGVELPGGSQQKAIATFYFHESSF